MTLHTRHLHEVPVSPPDDVLGEIAVAAGAYDRLAAEGRRLHFELHPATGALRILLLDTDGNELATVAPRRVLELAAGADAA